MAADNNKELEQEVTGQDHADMDSVTEVDGVATENPDNVQEEAVAPPANVKKDVLTDSFETVLTNFYKRYHTQKLKFVPQLVERYKGREEEVLMYLANRYRVNPSTIAGTQNLPDVQPRRGRRIAMAGANTATTGAAGGAMDSVSDVADAPKKKGKGMLIVIVLIIVLGGGGAGAYFSGMLGGGGHDDAHATDADHAEEAEAPTEEAAAPVEVETPAPVEEEAPVEDADSTGTTEGGGEAEAEDTTEEDIKEAAEAIDAVLH